MVANLGSFTMAVDVAYSPYVRQGMPHTYCVAKIMY
jgi:hypothetical protein